MKKYVYKENKENALLEKTKLIEDFRNITENKRLLRKEKIRLVENRRINLKEIDSNQEYSNFNYCIFEEDSFKYNEPDIIYDIDDIHEAVEDLPILILRDFNFRFCCFSNCDLSNIKFDKCSFEACQFENCIINVEFYECEFETMTSNKVIDTNFIGSWFNRCKIQAKFVECNLGRSIISKCELKLTKFTSCILDKVIIDETSLQRCKIEAGSLYGTRIINCDFLNVNFESIDKINVSEDTFIDFKRSKDIRNIDVTKLLYPEDNYEKEKLSYQQKRQLAHVESKTLIQISKIFSLNYLDYISYEYYYYSKVKETKSLTLGNKIKSYFFNLIGGYGERPSHTFIFAIFVIILYGILYYKFGIKSGCDTIKFTNLHNIVNMEILKIIIHDLWKCIYFSITTFTTVGYGNFIPKDYLGELVSSSEMLLGIGLTTLWTSLLVRKYTR